MLVAVLAAVPGWVAAAAEPIRFQDGLGIESFARSKRDTIFADPIEARVSSGAWRAPAPGEEVVSAAGKTNVWKSVAVGTNGDFQGKPFTGGWAWFEVTAPAAEVRMLDARGHDAVYVNGEPHAGDVYNYGYVHLPVQLRAGRNEFLFRGGRGTMRAELTRPPAACFFNLADATLPDYVVQDGRSAPEEAPWAGIIVVNATERAATNLVVAARLEGRTVRTPLPVVPPLSVRKVPVQLPRPARTEPGEVQIELRLTARGEKVLFAKERLAVRVRASGATRKVTFKSDIDDSIQYYAVNPASQTAPPHTQSLFLSLHGASVEAIGQADSYAPKSWGTLVAPTNRRPYGFDWEEWGRWDALEVLALAKARYQPAVDRIYLTGHSMGGHGTWNLGAHFPGMFAAIAPSAGWISFWSYGGIDPLTNATPVQALLRRAAAGSDTLAMAPNYSDMGVYILHGDADDNVPVEQAREMRRVLGAFHHDFSWHEQAGAGHWWDDSDEPGASCVDYPPLFDFFARHRLPQPAELRRLEFTTVNPGVSSGRGWAQIWAQTKSLAVSSIALQWDPGLRRVVGATTNVSVLRLQPPGLGAGPADNRGFDVSLDGQSLTNVAGHETWLVRRGEHWAPAPAAPAGWKNPERAGLFRDAFRHHLLFVYGTHGSPEETAWAKAKARFDAEAFLYRGNGGVEVLADTDFSLAATKDRGVVLYGHREMNLAWSPLLADSPVQVDRSGVRVGGRRVGGGDLGCLFIRPRPDSAIASVSVVAGTGLAGMRSVNRLPYFMAGPGYPDVLVLGVDAWMRGTLGVRGAGFFGPDWSVESGDFTWAAD